VADKKKISASIDRELAERLEKLTDISGKTFSHFINVLLKRESEFIDRLILKYLKIKEKFGGEE